MTDVEFCISTARVLLPDLEKTAAFVNRALAETVDQRLRFLLSPALTAIEQKDAQAAARWLDRAIEYQQARRGSCDPAIGTGPDVWRRALRDRSNGAREG